MTTIRPRILLGVLIAASTASVVGGFLVLGSPARQRELRLDSKRVEDLGEIAMALNAYHKRHNVLPATLRAAEEVWSRAIPSDPLNSQPYEFNPLDSGRYELCAVFQNASDYGARFWAHRAGRHCFTLSTTTTQNAFED